MGIYRTKYILKNNDVNMYRKLRTSRLFEMIQAGCVMHTEELGAGRTKTLDKGILWVVIQQYVEIIRMPEYDEEITLETWPGETMHVLFPRYFRVVDKDQNVLVNGSALWTLIDAKTRSFVFASQHDITVPGEHHEGEAPLPKAVKSAEADHHCSFTVPYSYCDLNGHMNNARYLDVAEDHLSAPYTGTPIKTITTQYEHEIKFNETIDLSWCEKENTCYITGANDKTCFKICIAYKGPGSD